jgi:hypothetical protein
LLFAATGHTAAELIVDRADADSPNMALTTWKGGRVRKQDVVVAKNYLSADEIDTLERLVTIFLEQAELRVKQKNDLTLAFWQQNVDRLLEFNDQPILDGPGTISHEAMKKVIHERYDEFDQNRRSAEAIEADREDFKQLEELEDELKRKKNLPEGND